MGSFLCSLIVFLPIYFGMKRFVLAYRAHIGAKIEKWKIYQLISTSAPVRWYEKIKNLGS